MALDTSAFMIRLKALLPSGWFASDAPILDSILSGPATLWVQIHALTEYARAQLRVHTATGAWLDAIASDFLGNRLTRRLREQDDHLRDRILRELLRERTTRTALIQALSDVTGRPPLVFEPAHAGDTGAYRAGGGGGAGGGGLAYGLAGGWGSLNHPFQIFVTALRPSLESAAYGMGWGTGAYNLNLTAYTNLEATRAGVTDEDIVRAARDIMPAATIAWLRIAG